MNSFVKNNQKQRKEFQIVSKLKQLNDTGDNLSLEETQLTLLREELSARMRFSGKIDFTGIEFSMELPNLVGQKYEVSEYFSLDGSKYESQIIRELYDPSRNMKLLKAVTGFGKSTKFPFIMSNCRPSALIIVVEPSEVLVRETVNFVSRSYNVNLLTAEHDGPLPAAGVLYTSARNLLVYLLKPSCRLPDDVILQIDESHMETPEYDTLYMLLNHDVITVQKVILTSATHKGNMMLEKRVNAFMIEDEPLEFDVEFSNELLIHEIEDGCLSASNLQGRCMVFLPDANYCALALKLFRDQGIPVRALTEYSDYEDLKSIRSFLAQSNGSRRILVTTSILETGVTLPIDAVYDFSLTDDVFYDGMVQKFTYGVRGITNEEAMQRRGRCGRLTHGRYYYVPKWRVETKPKSLIPTMLWYAVFGFKLPDKKTEKVRDYVGPLTKAKAAMILQSGLHPLYLLPYFDEEGYLLSNCSRTLTNLFPIRGIMRSTEVVDVETLQWNSVRVRQPTGYIEVKIPYPYTSYDSVINVIIAVDMLRSGTSFGEYDTYQNKPFIPPKGLLVDSGFEEPFGFEGTIHKLAVRRKVADSYGPSVNLEDLHEFSTDIPNKIRRARDSTISSFSCKSCSVTGKSEFTTATDKDELSRLIKEAVDNSLKAYMPPGSPVPPTIDNKRKRSSWIKRSRPLSTSKLSVDQLVMPMGCRSMDMVCTDECNKFIRKLLKGNFDTRTVPIDELKRLCVYMCQFLNYTITECRSLEVTIAYDESLYGKSWYRDLFCAIGRQKRRLKVCKATVESMKKIIPVWQRMGLYLVPYKYGPTAWFEDADAIFVNDFLTNEQQAIAI